MKIEFRYESLKSKFQFNSFCQQVDDWILLKITEKITGKMIFNKRKRNSL